MLKTFFIALALSNILSSCAYFSPFSHKKTWSKAPLTVETLSLFNQKVPTMKEYRNSWEGDWLLRRKRLALLDNLLATNLPNIIFFQEMLKKNTSDSDAAILESSSLAYYKNLPLSIKEDPETGEEEFAATYIRLEDMSSETIHAKQTLWELEESSYIVFQKLSIEEEPLYLFNVNFPRNSKNPAKLFVFLRDKIEETLKTHKLCNNHVIVAGYFGNQKLHELNLMMRFLDLVDTASDFCDDEHLCDTKNPSNPIFNSSELENKFKRTDRIFVHKSTEITSAQITYEKHVSSLPSFKAKYHLHSIAPSLRYGWQAKIKFSQCKQSF